MSAAEVRVANGAGGYLRLSLARQRGQPMYVTRNIDWFRPSLVLGETTYASFDPRTQGVYAQDDLSGGIGRRFQVPSQSGSDFKRVRYGEYIDYGIYGIGKGPAITSITKLTNMGSLTGAFELGSTLYLIGSRIIASYDAGAGTISEAEDLGASVTGYGGATWLQLGSEASDVDTAGSGATTRLDAATDYLAQKITPTATGYLSKVVVNLTRTGTITGNAELGIQMDLNGQPSGVDLGTSAKLASEVATSAGNVTFRFDDDETILLEKSVPIWVVLRVAAAAATTYIDWTRSNSSSSYASGQGATSTDSGASWTNLASNDDFDTETYMKSITATSFVGKDEGAKFLTTTDGATFTADGTFEGKHLVVYEDLLVRDCRADSNGAIAYSSDGKNWSEAIQVGDPTIQVTALLVLPSVVVVCKEDSIWAVNLDSDPVNVQLLMGGGKATTNGVGAKTWKGVAYIPFDGKLAAVRGDFDSGFTVYESIGPESQSEWEAPWGAGRVVAVAADRFCLYIAMSSSTSYKLLKSYSPLEEKWIGHMADLGTPTTFTFMHVFERGGTNSPLLFFSQDSDNIGRITLPRTPNPFADTAYNVNTANAGVLYFPAATGNMPASPKSWLYETITFRTTASGGYAEMLWDSQDGDGYRLLPGRLYDTGEIAYPAGLSSRLLDRQLNLTAGSATAYPVLVVSGLTYAVRPTRELREHAFTLDVMGGKSARELAVELGVSHARAMALLQGAPVSRGTRTLIDPEGDRHQVLFRSVNRAMVEDAEDGHSYFEVVAVEA